MKKYIILAVISGILLSASFSPINLNFFAFIAFVPLLFIINDKETKHPFLLSYVTFFIYHTSTNWWISSWRSTSSPYLFATGLGLDFIHPLFFLIPVLFYRWFLKFDNKNYAWKSIYLFPFIWVAFEWLHSLGELGYPWLTIGKSQITFLPWIQFIDLTGIFGASLAVVIINVAIYRVIEHYISGEKKILRILRARPYAISFIVILIILPLFYGFKQLEKYDDEKLLKQNKSLNIALIQPAYDAWIKWETSPMMMVERHFSLIDSLMQSKKHNIDLAVWPETSIPFLGLDFSIKHNFSLLTDFVESRKVPLLVGFADTKVFAKKKAPATADPFPLDTSLSYISYNSTLMLNLSPYQNAQPRIYHKMRLTPFAERVPYVEAFSFMKKFMSKGIGLSGWGKGTNQHNLMYYKDNKASKIGSVICIESIYPDFVRRFTKMGAEILIIQTNDAWYDYTWGPRQHYMIAQIRAIENRRYIARCANTGISGWISPTGRSLATLKQYEPVAGSMKLPLLKEKSYYVRKGDWLAILCIRIVYYSILIIICNMIIERVKKWRHKRNIAH